ncbi:MAG: hypothetical protein ACYDG6_11265 [Thermincolia bacterium]
MNRKDFFERAKKHGHDPKNKKKINTNGRNAFKSELLEYFNSPQGQKDVSLAPPWLKEKTADEIVELLLQEVN